MTSPQISRDLIDQPLSLIFVNCILVLAGSFAIYLLCHWLGADAMELEWSELWMPEASLSGAIGSVWFIFAWAAGLSLLACLANARRPRAHEPGEIFWAGIWISAMAGFFEELAWRGFNFLSAMAIVTLVNWLTFGLSKWLYTELLGPVANWATLGYLEPQLLGGSWVIGAAILSANADFRNGHRYLGLFGYVNSWFIGMVMFYLVFHYGLLAAIVAHILYDLCIFTVRAIGASWQPQPTPITNLYRRTY